jgi:hypothetical protein
MPGTLVSSTAAAAAIVSVAACPTSPCRRTTAGADLALQPDRRSTLFRAARLAGLAGIIVTFIVYHAAISHLLELDGWALAADNLLHTVVPVMAVAGWLLYGPRGMTSARIAILAAIYPVCWMVFTLIRGPIVDWYPYHFVDVTTLGYGKVALNSVWVAILFLGVSAAATALDARLPRPASERAVPEAGLPV